MKLSLKKVLSFLFVMVLMVGFSSCKKSSATANSENGAKDFVKYDDIQKEFKETVNKLNWPEGYKAPEKLDDDANAVYQEGFGDTLASNYWECAWQEEWLKNYKTNPQKAQKAIEELEKALSMRYLSKECCDDATRKFFKDRLDKAKANDPSGFEENLRLNDPR